MNDPSTLAESAWVRFEDIIQRFEEAWRGGERPDIAQFLSNQGATDRRILAELAHIDLEFRLRAEEDAHAEEYLQRFPQLLSEPKTAIELIAAEYALRRRWRSGAKREDFLKRFPEFEKELLTRLSAVETLGHSHRLSALSLGPSDVPQLPGFAIQKEVGRGGMGIVYRALDLRLNRVVALKTLASGNFAAPVERERFRHEAEAIAHLDHPNIVPVFEVGEYEGLPFFSMKYFAGGSLAQYERGRNSDPHRIAELVRVVADAVHHGHQRGILHRDLKPSNILLDEEGRPYVTDFGLAKRFDPKAGPLDVSTIAGTPAYMAPEQAAGKGDLTTATDVYGLGAILYELLTGAKPFSGDSPLTILQQLSEQPPTRPTIHNPKLPRDLETITLKCLEKNPQRRYPSALELADDIQRWQTGEPIQARPVSAWERSWRTVRRHPVVSGLVAATIAAVIFAIITLSINRDRIHAALALEQQATRELSDALEREREHLYQERVSSAWRMWGSNHAERAEELLGKCPERFRRWEWFLLDKLRRQEKVDMTAGMGRVYTAAYSPDGRFLALSDIRGAITLHDPADGLLIRTIIGETGASRLTIDPTGELIAAIVGKSVSVWKTADGEKVLQRPAARWVAFSPDSKTLAIGNERIVELVDLQSRQVRHTLAQHNNAILCGGFNQAGQLATGGADRMLRIWDCANGSEVCPARTYAQPINSLAWIPKTDRIIISQYLDFAVIDPMTGKEIDRIGDVERGQVGLSACCDGKLLAFVAPDGTIRIRDMATGHDLQSLRGHQPPITALSFDPTGKRLLSVGANGAARIWKLGQATEGRLLTPLNLITDLSFTRDGSKLAAARFFPSVGPETEQAKVFVLDVKTGQQLLSLPGNHDAAFAPNDKWIVTLRGNGSISAFDAGTGGELWNHNLHTHRCSRLALSSDGRMAAGTESGDVLIWDRPGQGDPQILNHHGMQVTAICFCADGQYLASASRDGTIAVWDQEGNLARRFDYGNSIQTVALSKEGRLVAASGAGRVIRIWNVATGAEEVGCHGHINHVLSIAFSPDGRRLVSGGVDTTARLWDVATGREIMHMPGSRGVVNKVAFSHDGRIIAAASQGLKLWETDDGPHCP